MECGMAAAGFPAHTIFEKGKLTWFEHFGTER
jgi:hypothetical protein